MVNKFNFLDNFTDAAIVIDDTGKILFKNYMFLKSFGNIKNLERFSYYFSFDICLLDTDNIQKANPIYFAVSSDENFFASCVYQKTKDMFQYFEISSFFYENSKVILFHDVTVAKNYTELKNSFEKLNKDYKVLADENKDFANFQQKAQNQAIKMALMHRVSNVIRESININKIISSALKELYNLFAAIKVYYTKIEDNKYIIEHVYPSKYKNCIETVIELEPEALRDILSKNIRINHCLKEYLNSKNTYPAPVTRIIVPVYRMNETLGLLIIYTAQKNTAELQNDVLQSIATQLATAIVQASLFEQITAKNEELQTTLTELKETQIQLINSEKMASLGQLVAGVAHEINTPLGSINSNNGILNKLIKRMPADKNLETMLKINEIDKEAIKRISQIVQSLKKFVRLDESELQFADINKEIDLTLEIIKHETKNKIKIIKNYSELPQIKCYPNILNQVFMNLLVNACQSIETDGEINITTEFSDGFLTVKIKDNGTGIDESIKDKIFTAGTTTKKIGIGTGLGLAISQKIIQKHNGTISFTSEKGKGTEFILKIPQMQ